MRAVGEQNRMGEEVVWQDILSYIRENITDVEYHTWFQHIRPLSVESNTLVLGVPTSFAGDWIRKHYSTLIMDALQNLGATDPNIDFKVVPGTTVQDDIFSTPDPVETTKVQTSRPAPLLNLKYTFENFVVGPNNNLSHAAALAVAESPGRAYNPLFIYGGVGLGKTHLMHAVGHYVVRRFPNLRVEYVSTETFTNNLINAIREDRMSSFRERYRSVDLLLVDDIQFIAGKERTQEEFFHTFNTLYESHKQIILSSDRPPKNILTLEARLRSRFEWGLITDVQSPELETRIAILKMNAEYRGLILSEEVFESIARQVVSNIRELEGALVRVIAYASLNGVEINRQVVAHALSEIFTESSGAIGMEEILSAIAAFYKLRTDDLRGQGRKKEVVLPRQIAMYLIRELTDASLPEIGQFFHGRDHTTVMYAVQKIQTRSESDAVLREVLETVRQRLE